MSDVVERMRFWAEVPAQDGTTQALLDGVAEIERLTAAHNHQYAMAGLMLREAERYGRERDEAILEGNHWKEAHAEDVSNLTAQMGLVERERDEAKEYGTRMRREWQRECEDTNLMLQGLGLCPSEYRSEGGSLMLGRIQHSVKKREAIIVAERDEAVALLREARDKLRELDGYSGANFVDLGIGIDGADALGRIDAFLAKVTP